MNKKLLIGIIVGALVVAGVIAGVVFMTPDDDGATTTTTPTTTMTTTMTTTTTKHVHVEVVNPAVAATCTETGVSEGKYCSECGEILVEQTVIDALGHSWKDATCTLAKTCSACSATEGTALGHSWKDATCTLAKTCSACSATEGTANGCVAGDWIVDKQATKSEDGLRHKKCTVCGNKISEEAIPAIGSLGLEYILNGDGVSYSVTGMGTCEDTDLVIPSTYNGLPVTSIGDYAFYDCTSLTSIEIPDSVTSIGDYAFYNCQSLTNIEIPDSVISIGESAFVGCTSLASVEIPDSVTSIGYGAFGCCSSLTSISVDTNNQYYQSIDGNLYTKDGKTLVQYAGGKDATTFTIPNTVESIGDVAFAYCTSLASVEIPDTVTSIGEGTFAYCTSLASVEIPDTVESIGDLAFAYCTSLAGVEIPDSVTSIGYGTFGCCTSLESIEIPDSVTSIGREAFAWCTSLESIEIPVTVTGIGEEAFCYCTLLTSINYEGTINQWNAINKESDWDLDTGYYTVYCADGEIAKNDTATSEGLEFTLNADGQSYSVTGIGTCTDTCVKIPTEYNGLPVTSIGEGAFRDCTSLTSIEIPEGVTSIDEYAFMNCTLLTSIEIPTSVTSVGTSAFFSCISLEDVYYTGNVENWLKIVFSNLGFDPYNPYCHPMYYASNLYFDGELVTNIIIPDSVTSIGYCAFYGCSSLTSITIPEGVTSIGYKAFDGCVSLIEICDKSSLNITAGSNDNSYIGSYAKHIITDESQSAIKYVGDYVFYDDGTEIYLVKYLGSETEITLPIYDGGKEYGIWQYAFYNNDKIKNVIIPDCVTSIGYRAFYNFSSLTSIEIPDSVTSIGDNAFYGCSSLQSIDIPDTITSIPYQAFSYCTSLVSIEIPNSVTSIGYNAFYGCCSLIEICDKSSLNIIAGSNDNGYIGLYAKHIITDESESAIKTVGDYIFYDDGTEIYLVKYLGDDEEITLPEYDGGKEYGIWQDAFSCNDKIKNVIIPDCVTSIGDSAFYGCSSLTSIEIPDSVIAIGHGAFASCSSLKKIIIPDSVISIGSALFESTSCKIYCEATSKPSGWNENWTYSYSGTVAWGYVCTSEGLELVINSDGVSYSAIGVNDYNVTSIEIPATYNGKPVTSIGEVAFAYCTSLTSIEIPDSVTSIGYGAFIYCSSLTSINVDTNNQYYQSIDGNLYTKDGKTLMQYAIGKDATTFTIPDTVESIGDMAFAYCTSLTGVEIPDSVTSIGYGTFGCCTSLASVEIPVTVTGIGDMAFYDCTLLTSINFEGTINQWNAINKESDWDLDTGYYTVYCTDGEIAKNDTATSEGLEYTLNGDGVSYSVTGIGTCTDTDLVIPSTYNGLPVTSIGEEAFYYCISIESIVIPNSVTIIGEGAFGCCTSLKSIVIPDSVTSIGDYALFACNSLTSIDVDANNQYYQSIDGNLYSKDGKILIHYLAGKRDAEFTIPNFVTSIGEDAFSYSTALLSIVIPINVTSIDDCAFYYCTLLTSINYEGTIAQWISIDKGVYWNEEMRSYTIYCTDGEISKDGTVTYY